jgi:hypothetical protein
MTDTTVLSKINWSLYLSYWKYSSVSYSKQMTEFIQNQLTATDPNKEHEQNGETKF